MAYRSVSNFREKESKPTAPGEKIRRTYLWQMNAKGEKVLVIDQEIDQQAEIDSYLEETKIENILRRASIDPAIAERLKPETGGDIQDYTEAPQTLAELQNIMLRAERICPRKSSSNSTTTSTNLSRAMAQTNGRKIWAF